MENALDLLKSKVPYNRLPPGYGIEMHEDGTLTDIESEGWYCNCAKAHVADARGYDQADLSSLEDDNVRAICGTVYRTGEGGDNGYQPYWIYSDIVEFEDKKTGEKYVITDGNW